MPIKQDPPRNRAEARERLLANNARIEARARALLAKKDSAKAKPKAAEKPAAKNKSGE